MVDNPVWAICERVVEVQALLDDHVASAIARPRRRRAGLPRHGEPRRHQGARARAYAAISNGLIAIGTAPTLGWAGRAVLEARCKDAARRMDFD